MITIPAKTIVTKVKKPAAWFGVDYNMNIYRGCSHGCIYCDSRSDCYHNPEFGTVKVKEDALQIIRDELRRKAVSGVISTGAMSDPYNPLERSLCLTRNALELVNAYEFGIAIATKSDLVARDIDILQDIQKHSPVIVKMTITTANNDLCKKIEPHVSTTDERFKALRKLSDAGVFCGILMMPILPFINDTEENIAEILVKAKESGVKFVYPAFGVTMRSGNREYFYEKLDEQFPGIKQNFQRYGNQYMCTSPKSKELWGFFAEQCNHLGLLYNMKGIIAAYKRGAKKQLSFFSDLD